jgi:hypothetical protein
MWNRETGIRNQESGDRRASKKEKVLSSEPVCRRDKI